MKKLNTKSLIKNTAQIFAVAIITVSFAAPAQAQLFDKISKVTTDFFKKFSKSDAQNENGKVVPQQPIPQQTNSNPAQAIHVSNDGDVQEGEKLIREALANITVTDAIVHLRAEGEALKVEQVNTDNHTEIVPEYSETGLRFILRYDQTALDNPSLLVKDLAVITALTNSINDSAIFYGYVSNLSPHTEAELLTNVREGSLTAKAQWLQQQIHFLQSMKIKPEIAGQYNINMDVLYDELGSLKKKAEIAAAEAETYIKKQQKAYDKWKSESGALNALDAANEKLDELMMKNDRKGVKKLVESYLPWTLMEPVEANAWKIWLDAIENPDPNNTSIAFRGLSYTTDKLKTVKTENGEIYGFMAPVLTKNQGNYNRRLRSLATNRVKNGDRLLKPDDGIASQSIRIIDQMITHSKEPQASSFISFTFNPSVARGFSGTTMKKKIKGEYVDVPAGGLMVVKMDNRRLAPNLPSGFTNEIELLTPLLIFPDEIIAYRENLKTDDAYNDFLEEVSKKTGTNFKDWQVAVKDDGKTYKEFYKAFGFSFFKQMTNVGGGGKSCDVIFTSQSLPSQN